MKILLLPLTVPAIALLPAGARSVDGLPVVDAALPPEFILAAALSALKEGKPPLWHAPRLFVATCSSTIVGSGGFKGPPAGGRVEIGYGVAESRRGLGFATDAIRQLVREALDHPAVAEVSAETAVANVASRRVCEKNGFLHAGQGETDSDGAVDRWRLRKTNA